MDYSEYCNLSRTDRESAHKTLLEFSCKFLPKNGKVLHLSCTGGEYAYGACIFALHTDGYIYSLDTNPEKTKYAEAVNRYTNIIYKTVSAGLLNDDSLFYKNKHFDLIAAFGYLDHLPDIKGFMNTIRNIMSNEAVFVANIANNFGNPIGDNIFHIRHYDVNSLRDYLGIQKNEYVRFTYQDNTVITDNSASSTIVMIMTRNPVKIDIVDQLLPFQMESTLLNELFLPAAIFLSKHNGSSSTTKTIPLAGDKAGFIFWGPHLPLPPGFWHVEFFFEPASTIAGDTGFAGRKIRLDISTRNGEKIQYSLTLHESELLNGAHAWLHVQSADDLFEFRAYYEDDAHAGCPAADIFFTGVKLSHVTEREFSPHSTFLLKKAVKDEVKELLRTIYRSSRSLAKVCLRSAKKTAEDKVVPYAYSCMKSLLPGGGDVSGTSQSAISFNTVKSGDEFEDYMNRLNDINLEQTNYCTYQCIFCNRNSMTRKKGFMSLEDLAWVIKNITCRNSFSGHLQLPGWGESFLDTLLPEKIAMLRKNFPRARIMTTTTLGVNLQTGYFQDLVRSGLNLLQVSVRGLTRETYAAVHGVDRFELVMNNMKIIAEELSRTTQKCDVLVRGRLDASNAGNSLAFCPDNKQTAAKFQDKISSYGFYYSEDTLLNSGNTYIHNKLGPNPEPCSIYKGKLANTLIVTWDLHVLPCARIGNNEVVLGNLREKSLREIFYDQPRRDFLQAHKTLQLKEKYPFCWYCRQDEAGWSKAS
jgi:MoaA/NifB/PqqE/SkfB family radical SAM enzyme